MKKKFDPASGAKQGAFKNALVSGGQKSEFVRDSSSPRFNQLPGQTPNPLKARQYCMAVRSMCVYPMRESKAYHIITDEGELGDWPQYVKPVRVTPPDASEDEKATIQETWKKDFGVWHDNTTALKNDKEVLFELFRNGLGFELKDLIEKTTEGKVAVEKRDLQLYLQLFKLVTVSDAREVRMKQLVVHKKSFYKLKIQDKENLANFYKRVKTSLDVLNSSIRDSSLYQISEEMCSKEAAQFMLVPEEEASLVLIEGLKESPEYMEFVWDSFDKLGPDADYPTTLVEAYQAAANYKPKPGTKASSVPAFVTVGGGKKGAKKSDSSGETCSYCKRTGHSVDRCWSRQHDEKKQKEAAGGAELDKKLDKAVEQVKAKAGGGAGGGPGTKNG